ncbi:MAG: hypothetical protein QXU44_03440 [Candidatus Caldarchaeum sp.]
MPHGFAGRLEGLPENAENIIQQLDKTPNTTNLVLGDKTVVFTNSLGQEHDVCGLLLVHRIFYTLLGASGDARLWFLASRLHAGRGENEVIIQMTCRSYYNTNHVHFGLNVFDDMTVYLKHMTGSSYPVLWAYVIYQKQKLLKDLLKYTLPDEAEIVKSAIVSARLAKSIAKTKVPIINLDNGLIIGLEPVQMEEVLFTTIFGYYLRRLQNRDIADGDRRDVS